MVSRDDFKARIEAIISQEYKVEFLGKNFDQIVSIINENKAEKIYKWISEVVNKNVQPIFIGSNKRYKDWLVGELLTFRYPFNVANTEYRILFIKIKNSIYIECHLGDHKYYDKIRKGLDLKKGSY